MVRTDVVEGVETDRKPEPGRREPDNPEGTILEREILPVKPLTLVRFRIVELDEPSITTMEAGLGEIVKSTTLTIVVALWDRIPPVSAGAVAVSVTT